jgi:beta-glucosidase
VVFSEGLAVGYRWYDQQGIAPLFPFGHGLSYTRFDYTDLSVDVDAEGLTVRVSVVNTGDREGREVVQVYTGLPTSRVSRPPRWLAGFAGVTVAPGGLVDVEIRVPRDELGYWDVRAGRRLVEAGQYAVSVGASSRDLRLHAEVTVDGDDAPVIAFSTDSTLGELLDDPVAAPIVTTALEKAAPQGAAGGSLGTDMLRMLGSIPVGRMVSFSGGAVSRQQLTELLDEVNRQRS